MSKTYLPGIYSKKFCIIKMVETSFSSQIIYNYITLSLTFAPFSVNLEVHHKHRLTIEVGRKTFYLRCNLQSPKLSCLNFNQTSTNLAAAEAPKFHNKFMCRFILLRANFSPQARHLPFETALIN